MTEWISGAKAAEIIGSSRRTVLRSLSDPVERARQWGKENDGWRRKPLSTRGIYQVSRDRAEKIARGEIDGIDAEPSA